jgi:hypothetical protein
MKRLRDDERARLEHADALRLLRAVGPLKTSDRLARAVRRSLDAKPPSRSTAWLPRPAFAVVAVGLMFGIASAMTVRWYRSSERAPAEHPDQHARAVHRAPATPIAPPIAPPAADDDAPPRHQTRVVATARPPIAPAARAPSDEHQIEPAAESASASESSSGDPVDPPAKETVPTPPTPAAPTPSSSEALTLYLDGLRALRKTHDRRRASTLLEIYRQRYPSGAFVEESWALSIEAAAQMGGTTRELAGDYLARFPQGRYRALATEALKR